MGFRSSAIGRLLPSVHAPALGAGRLPMHPGRFLETRFLIPLGVSQDALARTLAVSRRRVNELVRGKRGITPDTALRLALRFGLEAEFWLGLQNHWDLHQLKRRYRRAGGEKNLSIHVSG